MSAVYANTPVGVRADGVATLPSAFTIKSLVMQNSKGQTQDLRRLVTGFSIAEDLFSPVLELSMKFRDDQNFMEDFSICGQELIHIELTRTNHEVFGDSRPIKLDFIVVSYGDHSRDDRAWHVQNYTLKAISDFAYVSGLKKISRAITGPTHLVIGNILQNDLNVASNRIIVQGEPVSAFSGVVTIQPPLSAVKWLAQKTFDGSGSPFFVHQTASTGNIFISPYSDLVNKQNSFGTYYFDYVAKSAPHSAAGFGEQSSRILSMQANMAFNRFEQARSGAFASSTNFIDVASKTFYNRSFKAEPTTNSLGFKTGKATETPMALHDLPDASINTINMNSMSFGARQSSSRSGGFDMSVHNAYAAMASAETYSHVIVLHGNFELNPGTIITLVIPKSLDPTRSQSPEFSKDTNMSGQYLIRNSVHSFEQGTYQTTLKIIRN